MGGRRALSHSPRRCDAAAAGGEAPVLLDDSIHSLGFVPLYGGVDGRTPERREGSKLAGVRVHVRSTHMLRHSTESHASPEIMRLHAVVRELEQL